MGECLKKAWKYKVMSGQYFRNVDRQLIGEEDALLWQSDGDLKQKLKVKYWQHKTGRYTQNVMRQKY